MSESYHRMRASLEKMFGVYVYRRRFLPPGVRLNEDLRRYLPTLAVRTVFDVGANVGQSAEQYLEWFPDANVYCFEPVAETFTALSRNVARHKRVHCHQLAVGALNGASSVVLGKTSDLAFIPDAGQPIASGSRTESIAMVTVDAFSDREGVRKIDFLKIDTEGHDFAVLQGCEQLLRHQHIGVIQVEAGMNPTNRRHVPFETIKTHLQSRGYSLFGIYEQVHEWSTPSGCLRRANPVFVSTRLLNEAVAV